MSYEDAKGSYSDEFADTTQEGADTINEGADTEQVGTRSLPNEQHEKNQQLFNELGSTPVRNQIPSFKGNENEDLRETAPSLMANPPLDATINRGPLIPGQPFDSRQTVEMPASSAPKGHPARMEEGIGGEASPSTKPKPEPIGGSKYNDEAVNPLFSDDYVYSKVELAITKVAHTRFLKELEEIAETQNKYIVAAFMARYSEQLEDTNPHAAKELLKAAQSIAND